jgi:hypothetical protein
MELKRGPFGMAIGREWKENKRIKEILNYLSQNGRLQV